MKMKTKNNVSISPFGSNSKVKRKRLPELDDVDLDIEPSSKRSNTSRKFEHSVLLDSGLPNSPAMKAESKKEARKEDANNIPAPNVKSFQPGERTALLASIRKRITELEARTVYVRHLPRCTTEAQLKKFCPTSIAIKLCSKKRGGHRRGYAFMEFKSEEAARAAVANTNGKLIADRPIELQLCSARPHDPLKGSWIPADRRQLTEFSINTLAVSCVPRVASQEDLHKLFPASESIEIVRSGNKVPTGLCIVRFRTDGDALASFTTQHGAMLHGTPVIVNFAYKKGYSNKRNEVPTVTSPKTLTKSELSMDQSELEIAKIHSSLTVVGAKKSVGKKKKTENQQKCNFPPKELKQPLGKVKMMGKR